MPLSTKGKPFTNCVAVPSSLIKLCPPTSFCKLVRIRSRSSKRSAEGALFPGLIALEICKLIFANSGNRVLACFTVSVSPAFALAFKEVMMALIPCIRLATSFAAAVMPAADALLVGSAAYVPMALKKVLNELVMPVFVSDTRLFNGLVY